MRAIVAGVLCLLALPVAAQPAGRVHGSGGLAGAPHPSSPRPAIGGFGNHAGLPHPHQWTGNLRNFGGSTWGKGHWYHGLHNGALAWWWVAGPEWYYFDAPIYPAPDFDVPPGMVDGWWYWCAPAQEYYPYVTYCPAPWVRVPR